MPRHTTTRPLLVATAVLATAIAGGCTSSFDMETGQSTLRFEGTSADATAAHSTSRAVAKSDSWTSTAMKARRDPHLVVSYPDNSAAAEGMPTIDPITGEPYRMYYYYPDSEVYLDVKQSRYFWRDHTGWRSDRQLPAIVASGMSWSNVERIGVSTDRPSDVHAMVSERYPKLSTLRRHARTIDRAEREESIATVPWNE